MVQAICILNKTRTKYRFITLDISLLLNMTFEITKDKFTIPLIARVNAEKFRQNQSSSFKAKQVYLNTLAVSTVNLYLNTLGWATNLKNSDSWNPLLQTMMDIADLDIPNYGKIECRSVLPDEHCITVPSEVGFQRIAYVGVEFNTLLTEAKLLGFVPKVNSTKLDFAELRSLAQLPF